MSEPLTLDSDYKGRKVSELFDAILGADEKFVELTEKVEAVQPDPGTKMGNELDVLHNWADLAGEFYADWEDIEPDIMFAYGVKTLDQFVELVERMIETHSIFAKTDMTDMEVNGQLQSMLDYLSRKISDRAGVKIERDRSVPFGFYDLVTTGD